MLSLISSGNFAQSTGILFNPVNNIYTCLDDGTRKDKKGIIAHVICCHINNENIKIFSTQRNAVANLENKQVCDFWSNAIHLDELIIKGELCMEKVICLKTKSEIIKDIVAINLQNDSPPLPDMNLMEKRDLIKLYREQKTFNLVGEQAQTPSSSNEMPNLKKQKTGN